MRKLLVICLGVLIFAQLALGSSLEEFALADRVGEPNARTFFLFSTSAGNYAVRQDGMGEFTSPKGMRRVFNLRVAGRGRISSIYFLEHNGDLMLLYEVGGQGSYLVRLEQTKRKLRWSTPLQTSNVEAPVIEGDLVVIKEAERSIAVGKADGKVIRQD
jgi:hypothetical protein